MQALGKYRAQLQTALWLSQGSPRMEQVQALGRYREQRQTELPAASPQVVRTAVARSLQARLVGALSLRARLDLVMLRAPGPVRQSDRTLHQEKAQYRGGR